MKKFIIKHLVFAAQFHIDKANEMILLKSKNLAYYGSYYSKSLEYQQIEFKENFHLIFFKFYKQFLPKEDQNL